MKVNYSLTLVSTTFGIIAVVLLYKGMAQFRKSMEHKDEWHNA